MLSPTDISKAAIINFKVVRQPVDSAQKTPKCSWSEHVQGSPEYIRKSLHMNNISYTCGTENNGFSVWALSSCWGSLCFPQLISFYPQISWVSFCFQHSLCTLVLFSCAFSDTLSWILVLLPLLLFPCLSTPSCPVLKREIWEWSGFIFTGTATIFARTNLSFM